MYFVDASRGRYKNLSYTKGMKSADNWLGEIVGLASGAKRMATLEITDEEQVKDFKEVLNLYAPENNFEFLKTGPYDWIKKVNPDYKYSLLVGKSKSDLKEFKELYNDAYGPDVVDGLPDHVKIAKLLSYPECCAKDHWDPSKTFRDYFETGVVNKVDYRINNFYLRSPCNASIILHYVCSYGCKKTIEYAEEVLNFVKENYPEIHSFYRRVLRLPVLIIFPHTDPTTRTIGDGVVLTFEGDYEDEKTLVYSKVYQPPFEVYKNAEEGRKIYEKVLQGGEIKIKDGGMEIYSEDDLKESIDNDRLVFINPKEQ